MNVQALVPHYDVAMTEDAIEQLARMLPGRKVYLHPGADAEIDRETVLGEVISAEVRGEKVSVECTLEPEAIGKLATSHFIGVDGHVKVTGDPLHKSKGTVESWSRVDLVVASPGPVRMSP